MYNWALSFLGSQSRYCDGGRGAEPEKLAARNVGGEHLIGLENRYSLGAGLLGHGLRSPKGIAGSPWSPWAHGQKIVGRGMILTRWRPSASETSRALAFSPGLFDLANRSRGERLPKRHPPSIQMEALLGLPDSGFVDPSRSLVFAGSG
jgi:hypothetical protein